jgi:hypothetical protein
VKQRFSPIRESLVAENYSKPRQKHSSQAVFYESPDILPARAGVPKMLRGCHKNGARIFSPLVKTRKTRIFRRGMAPRISRILRIFDF